MFNALKLLTFIFLLFALAHPGLARHRHNARISPQESLECVFDNNGHQTCREAFKRVLSHPRASHLARYDANGNRAGNIRSRKTGAVATVSARAAGAMQAYIDDIEASGGIVYFMGGNRRGHCSPRHMHSCGLALDVCQLSRGVVSSKCHLPSPAVLAKIAARHGLFEGGQWCDSDYGHAQLGVSAPACGNTLMARRHYHHTIMARR